MMLGVRKMGGSCYILIILYSWNSHQHHSMQFAGNLGIQNNYVEKIIEKYHRMCSKLNRRVIYAYVTINK